MANGLVGTWRFQSWTARNEAGEVFNPLGEQVSGLLVIGADGWLSVHMMGKEPVQVTPDQAATYLGYAGPYQLAADQLVTTVEVSSTPDWVGTQQIRDVELTGDTLVLRPPPVGGMRHELRWRRIA